MLIYVLYIILGILLIVFGIIIYDKLTKEYLYNKIYSGDIVFIKSFPNSYKVVQGSKKLIKKIYPFQKNWSEYERAAVFSGRKQITFHKYENQLYIIKLSRVMYFGKYVLLVRMHTFNEHNFSQKQIEMFNNSDFYFFIVNNNLKTVFANTKATEIGLNDLYDMCCDKEMFSVAVKSHIPNNQRIKMKVKNDYRYIDFNFYQDMPYNNSTDYCFLLGYDITHEVNLEKQISVKTRVLDILKNRIYQLFTDPNLKRSLQSILYEVGTVLKAQRVYVYEAYKDDFILETDWHTADVKAETILYGSIKQEVYAKHFKSPKSEPIIVTINDIPKDRQIIWKNLGINYKIVIPLFSHKGILCGVLGFDYYNGCSISKWNKEQIKLAQFVGIIINTIMVLKQNKEEIRNLDNQLNNILKMLSININNEINNAKEINNMLRATA